MAADDLDAIQAGPGDSGGASIGGGGAGDSAGGNTGAGTGDSVGDDTGDTTPASSSTESGGVLAGNATDTSFSLASGDLLLSDSATTFRLFFETLKEEGAETLELLQSLKNTENPEIAALVETLGQILGEYDLIATAIPTNAFNDKAQILIPGLLTFEPAAAGGSEQEVGFQSYAPPSFGRFQF